MLSPSFPFQDNCTSAQFKWKCRASDRLGCMPQYAQQTTYCHTQDTRARLTSHSRTTSKQFLATRSISCFFRSSTSRSSSLTRFALRFSCLRVVEQKKLQIKSKSSGTQELNLAAPECAGDTCLPPVGPTVGVLGREKYRYKIWWRLFTIFLNWCKNCHNYAAFRQNEALIF